MTGLPVPPSVRWSDDGQAVDLLDQTLLPDREGWLRLETPEAVAEAITSLRVRGAPAIGIAGALGLAMAAQRALESRTNVAATVSAEHARLLATRPTGRNLGWALDRVRAAFETGLERGRTWPSPRLGPKPTRWWRTRWPCVSASARRAWP